jgi:hypothetical protein
MTNNLKAERTLTAFDAWFNVQEGYSLRSERFDGDVEWLKAAFEAGALSTQQPMGEITWERMARAQSRKLQAVLHVPGVKDVLRELDWENGDPFDGWDFVRLSELHPNLESVECMIYRHNSAFSPLVSTEISSVTKPVANRSLTAG